MKDNELIFGLMSAYGRYEYSFEELKKLTAPFDVSESSLRTNLSRMIQKNTVQSRKHGKTAYYGLSKKGSRISSNIAFSFKGLDWSGWDRKWWGVLFTVPDEKSPQRHAIRKKLIAYRFANLYPGFWIRPVHPEERIAHHLSTLIENKHCTLIQFDFYQAVTKADVDKLWKVEAVNCVFKETINLVSEHMQKLGGYSPEEGLKSRILVGNEIVNALFRDPLLPDEYLPEDWKAEELRQLFTAFDKKMTQVAEPYTNSPIS